MTNDVDIIVFLRREDARRLLAVFPAAEFYCLPLEVIESERSRDQRGHFNLIHHETGFKAHVYMSGKDDLHTWAIARAIEEDIDGDKVVFAPPDYVIVRKLQFFREGGSGKHLRDISRMLIGLGDDWNRQPLLEMIAAHKLQDEWQKALDQSE